MLGQEVHCCSTVEGCSTVLAHIYCCNRSCCQHVKMSCLLPRFRQCTQGTALLIPLPSLHISLHPVFPQATAVRANYDSAAFACWDRSLMAGVGRQVAVPGTRPHCPGAGRWPCSVWRQTHQTSSLSTHGKPRCAKFWNHNLLSWKWISQAKQWKSLELLKFHNTLNLMKNKQQRLNIFLQHPLKSFELSITSVCEVVHYRGDVS